MLKLHDLLHPPKQLEINLLDMLEQRQLKLHNPPKQLELHASGCSCKLFFSPYQGWEMLIYCCTPSRISSSISEQLRLHLLDMPEQLELELHSLPKQHELLALGCSHNLFLLPR